MSVRLEFDGRLGERRLNNFLDEKEKYALSTANRGSCAH
jgi:hypothetical protein